MSFDLLPAIDLRRGRAVRLVRGDDRARMDVGEPLELFARFARAGVGRVHVVDLDAAFGEAPQTALLTELAALARAGGPRLQLGGGLRTRESIARALDQGCDRAVVGSLVARDPSAFAALTREFPDRLIPALDGTGDEVRIAGWRESAPIPLSELCERLVGLACPAVLATDIERDGTLGGANAAFAARVARASGLRALVSGGISSLDDLAQLRGRPEIAGAVFGRALYAGAFTLEAALAVAAGERVEEKSGAEKRVAVLAEEGR